MDLEEWEFLSDDGFMDIHEDGTTVLVIGKKVISGENVSLHPNSIIDMNCFSRIYSLVLAVINYLKEGANKCREKELIPLKNNPPEL
ncbi:hypothetical protein Ancab_019387, partial [Ancistrocladus abbreviatus]